MAAMTSCENALFYRDRIKVIVRTRSQALCPLPPLSTREVKMMMMNINDNGSFY